MTTANIFFTPEQMIEALERIGYVIKEETIMVIEYRTGNTDQEVAKPVWNVYYEGQLMCSWGSAGMYRVQWIFERELEKKLLKLF